MRSPRALLLLLLGAAPLGAQKSEGYAGSGECARCHAGIHREWSGSRHATIFRPATKDAVEGDFAQRKVILHGATYLLEQRGSDFFVTESDLAGKPWEHLIEYTLGSRRIQHYLSTLPDGRIIVLPPSWDNLQKRWIHDLDAHNPEESATDLVPIWNKTCSSCHVGRAQKNFDAATMRYSTTWQEAGAGCESCHGPGRQHAARPGRANIVNPARLDAGRSVMVCAQCHSSRDIYAAGFAAGSQYADAFMPVMEYRAPASDDAAFWADGRPRWMANEAAALWQSPCYLKGQASCVTCHRPAHGDISARGESNAACAACHKAIAAAIPAHTHHRSNSAGSSCVECHMPATVTGLNARMRDHTIGVPVPENSAAHGIPNACNLCHGDKDAAWAVAQVTAWYGAGRRQGYVRRADAFTQARRGNSAAIPALLAILADGAAGAWVRANAAGYLGSFADDPAAYEAVRRALGDGEALVRATAESAIRPRAAQREALAPQLVALLNDPLLTVRVGAGVALVSMGVKPFPGEEGRRFEAAKELYGARAALNADDAGQQFAAGRFFFLAGDFDRAAAALRGAMRLDPATPAQFLLARALAMKNDFAGARTILEQIPRDHPDYAAARQLLAEVEAGDSGGAGSAGGQAIYLDGQVKYQSQYYGAALEQLDRALALAPVADWAPKARAYRAVCLEKLGRTREAEGEMRTLLATAGGRDDLDLQLAFAELLLGTARAGEALRALDGAVAAAPDAPLVHYWRARVLLELERTGEAAKAAEESIRLQPQLPQAHNLLVRIYQVQGRTKEAAQEAEWLREYQRRAQSH